MPLAARGFWYSATLFMLALVVAAAGCSDSGSQGASPLPPDKYVAVLETISYDATVIEGNCMLPAPSPLPPYPFDYDSTKGRITLSTSANASLKILYGIRHDSYVPWAMSYRLDTCGIYSLPYTCESGPVIADADGNGTVYLAWENRSIALKPGDGWSRESAPGIQVINRSGYSPFTARFVTTYRIANLGIFDKPRDKQGRVRHIGGPIIGHPAMFQSYLRQPKGEKKIPLIVDSPGGEAIFSVTTDGLRD